MPATTQRPSHYPYGSQTVADLVHAGRTISGAAHWVTAGLAASVEATGKPVNQLTVGELLTLIEAQRDRLNGALMRLGAGDE